MMKWISVLAALISTAVWADPAPAPNVRAPSAPMIDLMTNGGFEASKASWSNTGGTFSINTSTPLNGKASGAFLPSATGQHVDTSQFMVKEGLKGGNCGASVLYKTAEVTNLYTFQVVDGSSNVIAYVQLPSSPSFAHRESIAFPCPASGTLGLQVLSSGSAAAILMDDLILGSSPVFQLSQASFFGGAHFGTGGCSMVNTSAVIAGSAYSFQVDTGSCTPSVTLLGNATAGDSNNASVTFASFPPGNYRVVIQGAFRNNNYNDFGVLQVGQTGGTSDSVSGSYGLGQSATTGTINFGAHVEGLFTFPNAKSNVVFLPVGYASDSLNLDGADAGYDILVYRYPSESEQAYRPETINWYVDTIQGASGVLALSATNGSWGPIELTDGGSGLNIVNSGSLSAQQACVSAPATGLTCGSTGRAGIAINLPAAQTVKVCAEFDWSVNTGGATSYAYFKISEVDSAGGFTEVLAGNHTSQNGQGPASTVAYQPNSICQNFPASSAGVHTYEIIGSGTNTGGIGGQSIAASGGTANIHWTVRPLTQNLPAPVLVGSVVSPSAGVLHHAAAFLGGGGGIVSQSGNWITFNGGSSTTGKYVYDVTAGVFGNATNVVCTANFIDNGTTDQASVWFNLASTSSIDVRAASASGGGTPANLPLFMMCDAY